MTLSAPFLAQRFGYGLPLDHRPHRVLAGLAGPDHAAAQWPSLTTEIALQANLDYDAALKEEAKIRKAKGLEASEAARKARDIGLRDIMRLGRKGTRAALCRAIGGEGLRERLVRFWSDHFTTAPRARRQQIWHAAMVEDAIRPNIGGSFANLLEAVATSPAMLIYLDQRSSIGPNSKLGKKTGRGLNENYARELLELHTLGVSGDYSQDDVRQLAELLTGMIFSPKTGFRFDAARVEPGAEKVLGKAYKGKGMVPIQAVLHDLALHPQTARHISEKLAVHFISDTPSKALVKAMAKRWEETEGNLTAVTEILLSHPDAQKPEAVKARQPFDFIVASLRALQIPADRIYKVDNVSFDRLFTRPLAAMGQPSLAVPGPDGWPESPSAWITPAGMAARLDWALTAPEVFLKKLPDPRSFAETALGTRLSERLAWAVGAAESRREGIGLVLASPEFNRR